MSNDKNNTFGERVSNGLSALMHIVMNPGAQVTVKKQGEAAQRFGHPLTVNGLPMSSDLEPNLPVQKLLTEPILYDRPSHSALNSANKMKNYFSVMKEYYKLVSKRTESKGGSRDVYVYAFRGMLVQVVLGSSRSDNVYSNVFICNDPNNNAELSTSILERMAGINEYGDVTLDFSGYTHVWSDGDWTEVGPWCRLVSEYFYELDDLLQEQLDLRAQAKENDRLQKIQDRENTLKPKISNWQTALEERYPQLGAAAATEEGPTPVDTFKETAATEPAEQPTKKKAKRVTKPAAE